MLQKVYLSSEMNGKEQRSKLSNLDPVTDEVDTLLKVGGRIRRSPEDVDSNPVIVPKESKVVILLLCLYDSLLVCLIRVPTLVFMLVALCVCVCVCVCLCVPLCVYVCACMGFCFLGFL